jgi:hypothetical protein
MTTVSPVPLWQEALDFPRLDIDVETIRCTSPLEDVLLPQPEERSQVVRPHYDSPQGRRSEEVRLLSYLSPLPYHFRHSITTNGPVLTNRFQGP